MPALHTTDGIARHVPRRSVVVAYFLAVSFILGASYPVPEGTEWEVGGGFSQHEKTYSRAGCEGPTGRWVYLRRRPAGTLAVQHRFAERASYVRFHGAAGRDFAGGKMVLFDDRPEAGRHGGADANVASAALTYGMQGEIIGWEAGATILYNQDFRFFPAVPLPAGALRMSLNENLFLFGAMFTDPYPIYPPLRLGLGYDGSSVRARVSVPAAVDAGLGGSLDYDAHVHGPLWLGLGLSYVGPGRIEPAGALWARLTFRPHASPDSNGRIGMSYSTMKQ